MEVPPRRNEEQKVKRPVFRKKERVRLRKVQSTDSGGLYFANPKENVQLLRSGCTMLDCVLGGGWAVPRIINIVGDKSTGKTLLAMEAIANFFVQYPKGSARYNEAESAFEDEYAEALGIPISRVTKKKDCDTVEQFFDDLTQYMEKKNDEPGLYILDSLDSISDDAEMARSIGENTYGAAKAKQLSQFFRRIVRKLAAKNIILIIISQVRATIGVSFGEKNARSGGKALDFYASQILWLAHIKLLKRTINKVERPYGVRIRARCKKNKVGLPFRECEFEIRFGYGIEDVAASMDWAHEVGLGVPKGTTNDELRALVIKHWYKIEADFLPKEKKYGN